MSRFLQDPTHPAVRSTATKLHPLKSQESHTTSESLEPTCRPGSALEPSLRPCTWRRLIELYDEHSAYPYCRGHCCQALHLSMLAARTTCMLPARARDPTAAAAAAAANHSRNHNQHGYHYHHSSYLNSYSHSSSCSFS